MHVWQGLNYNLSQIRLYWSPAKSSANINMTYPQSLQWCICLSEHYDLLIGKILFDKAADKCSCLLGRLWTEGGRGEEISYCLCSNWLGTLNWLMAASALTTHHQHAEINKGMEFIRTSSKVYQEASAKTAETTERLHIHSFSVIGSPLIFRRWKTWQSILMLMWIYQLHPWHIRLHHSPFCMH